jgi:tRNA pseudouridine55 synthase
VRRVLAVRRAGHTGTLDPFASGLLLVLVGRATRLARFLVDMTKTYTGMIRLGVVTDTGDPTGVVVERSGSWRDMSDDRIARELRLLTGPITQVPPEYSAKKVAGERAYRRARRGEPVALAPREVHVFRFELVSRIADCVEFSCEVSSGTYVRALARDLGAALGCGACLEQLRRLAVGPHTVQDAIPLEAVRPDSTVMPPLEVVRHLPAVKIGDDARTRVQHGVPLPTESRADGPVALVAGTTLVAVAQAQEGWLRPKVVLEQ